MCRPLKSEMGTRTLDHFDVASHLRSLSRSPVSIEGFRDPICRGEAGYDL